MGLASFTDDTSLSMGIRESRPDVVCFSGGVLFSPRDAVAVDLAREMIQISECMRTCFRF